LGTTAARALNLPFITGAVLAEIEALATTTTPPDKGAVLDNSTDVSRLSVSRNSSSAEALILETVFITCPILLIAQTGNDYG
jgi:hypothetical protein